MYSALIRLVYTYTQHMYIYTYIYIYTFIYIYIYIYSALIFSSYMASIYTPTLYRGFTNPPLSVNTRNRASYAADPGASSSSSVSVVLLPPSRSRPQKGLLVCPPPRPFPLSPCAWCEQKCARARQ